MSGERAGRAISLEKIIGGLRDSQFEINFWRAYHLPKALIEFWEKHPNSKTALSRWFKVVKTNEFHSFADLRDVFPSADKVQNWIVFNIGGNKYRLIVSNSLQSR